MGTVGAQFMSLRPLRQDQLSEGAFGRTYHRRRRGASRQMTSRWRAGSICSAREFADLHEARCARHHPPDRCSAKKCRISKTAWNWSSDKDEFGMPMARIDPQLRRRRGCAVERQLRSRHEDRQGDDAKESWPGKGPSCRPAICTAARSWARAGQLGNQQFRPELTRCRICGWPAPASSRPKAHRIRPTRSSRCRCAVPSNWRRTWGSIAG